MSIITYEPGRNQEDLENWIKNTTLTEVKSVVIVMDEAHHMLKLLREVSPRQATKIVEKLNACQKILILTSSPFLNDDSDIRILINIAAGKNLLPISETGFRAEFYRVSKFHLFTFGWFFSILNGMYHSGATNIAELTSAYEVLTLGETSWQAKDLQEAAKADQSGILGPVVPILQGIAQGLSKLMQVLNINKLYKLNNLKFRDHVAAYVDCVPDNWSKAKVQRRMMTVEYSAYQIDIWVRFLINKLRASERKRMGLRHSAPVKSTNGTEFQSTYAPIQTDTVNIETYREKGRCIGNLHRVDTGGVITESPKFEKIFEIMMQTKTYNQAMRGIVIYSNYLKEGVQLFSEFLQRKKIKHGIFMAKAAMKDKQDMLTLFDSGKISVILLSPEYWESISIPSAQQLHILEPMMSMAMSDHITSRVFHLGNADSSRKIYIYTWCATTQSLFAKISRLVREETKVDTNRYQFVQDLSPDALVQVRYNVSSQGAREIAAALKSKAVAGLKESCNVCYDPLPDSSLPPCHSQKK